MVSGLSFSSLILNLLIAFGFNRAIIKFNLLKSVIGFHHVLYSNLEIGSLCLYISFTSMDDNPTYNEMPNICLNFVIVELLS